MKFFRIFICVVIPLTGFSQNYTGAVKNSKTSEGIPFVNIGIPSKAWGFISDERGNFTFKITSEKDTDSILFSLIGYIPSCITIAELKNKCITDTPIYLEEQTYNLEVITVTSSELETQILGCEKLEQLSCLDFAQVIPRDKPEYKQLAEEKGISPNAIGIELGNKINIKKGKQTFIDKIQFKACLQPKDTIIYRINIYSEGKTLSKHITAAGMMKEKQFENIMKEAVIVKCLGQTGIQTIDVSSQNIKVEDDFIVGLECIYSSNKKMEIGIEPALFGSTDLFMRLSVMSSWIEIPLVDATFVGATVSTKKEPSFWQRLFH